MVETSNHKQPMIRKIQSRSTYAPGVFLVINVSQSTKPRQLRLGPRRVGMMKAALLLFAVLTAGVKSGQGAHLDTIVRHFQQNVDRNTPNVRALRVDPEVYMDSTQLITSKGYPCENHYITTDDGFILNMQRIPHGRGPQPKLKAGVEKPVIILQHGLETSSSNWLDNLANESLAYILADKGADVWLGNVRGNMYSTNHTTLKPDQREFWAWSFNEMALLDLPAMVTHVIRTTGVKQVHYAGHSQGTMMGFAGFSSNHTLSAQIKQFYALAPVAKVSHITSPLRLFATFAKNVELAFAVLGHLGFLHYNKDIMDYLAKDVCGTDVGDVLCENFLFLLAGYDKTHFNQTRVPVYIGHNPGGTSVQDIIHFGQLVETDKFQKFDYGSPSANMKHYGQPTPPEYNLANFNVPVVMYTGNQDTLADPTDVAWLKDQVKSYLIDDVNVPAWAHLDFIWAFDAPKYCYDDLIKRLFQS